MWRLLMIDSRKEWITVDMFETVTAAAKQIKIIENDPDRGIWLEFHVPTEFYDNSDDNLFDYLEWKGKRASYAIKRVKN